jgi:serine/threonine protein kinase
MIVKVIDFGFMDVIKEFNIGKCGTPNYMAPEVIEGGVYDGAKVDGWALAILLFYLLEGRYPFKGYDEKDLFKNIKTK